jgi:hypothetical protein
MPLLAEVRHAVGLRKLGQVSTTKRAPAPTRADDRPAFALKRYRVPETRSFQFAVTGDEGEKVLVSQDYADPKQMGEEVSALLETLGWSERYALEVRSENGEHLLLLLRRADQQLIARSPPLADADTAKDLCLELTAWLDVEALAKLEKASRSEA